MNKKILIIGMVVIVLIGILYALQPRSGNRAGDLYRYEFDKPYPDLDTVAVVVHKVDSNGPKHYVSIDPITMAKAITFRKPDITLEVAFRIVEQSVTAQNISPINDDRYITGKFLDPQTDNGISRWTYDLDKKEFSEIVIDQQGKVLFND